MADTETKEYLVVLKEGLTVGHVVGQISHAGKQVDMVRGQLHHLGDEIPVEELPEAVVDLIRDGDAESLKKFRLESYDAEVVEPDEDETPEEPVDEFKVLTEFLPETDQEDVKEFFKNALVHQVKYLQALEMVENGGLGREEILNWLPADAEGETVSTTVDTEQKGDGPPVTEPGFTPGTSDENAVPPTGNTAPDYNPGEHTQEEVLEYLKTADTNEVALVKAAEASGKDRKQIAAFEAAAE